MTRTTLTTGMFAHPPNFQVMTGREKYPVLGDLVNRKQKRQVLRSFKGLARHWNCVEKAQLAQRVIGGVLTVGSFYVWDVSGESNYGFEFNPPFEVHSWLTFGDRIVDFALPGVIEIALSVRDAQGPLVTGRDPVILAGHPPQWCQYKASEFLI